MYRIFNKTINLHIKKPPEGGFIKSLG